MGISTLFYSEKLFLLFLFIGLTTFSVSGQTCPGPDPLKTARDGIRMAGPGRPRKTGSEHESRQGARRRRSPNRADKSAYCHVRVRVTR